MFIFIIPPQTGIFVSWGVYRNNPVCPYVSLVQDHNITDIDETTQL